MGERPGGRSVIVMFDAGCELHPSRSPQSALRSGRLRRRALRAPAGLDQLIESCYDTVKGQWEERFEHRYGFWRAAVEGAVFAFLLDPLAIRKILTHLARRASRATRGPPATSDGQVWAVS